MTSRNEDKYKCPECESESIRFKFKVINKDITSAYANVTEEIQCAKCFMDIPSIISENILPDNHNEMCKLWNEIYKHLIKKTLRNVLNVSGIIGK